VDGRDKPGQDGGWLSAAVRLTGERLISTACDADLSHVARQAFAPQKFGFPNFFQAFPNFFQLSQKTFFGKNPQYQ
jgi:hypothetical protein